MSTEKIPILQLPGSILQAGLLVGLIINLVHIGLMVFIQTYDWNLYVLPEKLTSPTILYFYEIIGNFISGLVIMIVFRGFFASMKNNFISSGLKSGLIIWIISRVFNAEMVVLKIIPINIFIYISLWLGAAYVLGGFIGAIYFKSKYKFKMLQMTSDMHLKEQEAKLNNSNNTI